MERRWGLRKPVDADVVIDSQPLCLLRGRIGNISIGGLYVTTTPTALNRNTPVELVLLRQESGGTRVYRLPAMIVRLTEEGAGLIFDRYHIDAFRTLAFLLRDSRRPGAGAPANYAGDAAEDSIWAGTTWGADGAAASVASIPYNHSPRNGEATN